jgi:hypothetical protein
VREPRRDRLRLQHMLDACDALLEFVSGRKEEDLLTNKLLLAAGSRQIEIIGEAASMVTMELRERHPEVPWPVFAASTTLPPLQSAVDPCSVIVGVGAVATASAARTGPLPNDPPEGTKAL